MCAAVSPVVDDVATRYPEVELVVVDVDAPGAELGSVKGVPTMAAITGDAEGTLRSRVHHTLQKLRAHFATVETGPDRRAGNEES